jgi:hypothetical protein
VSPHSFCPVIGHWLSGYVVISTNCLPLNLNLFFFLFSNLASQVVLCNMESSQAVFLLDHCPGRVLNIYLGLIFRFGQWGALILFLHLFFVG